MKLRTLELSGDAARRLEKHRRFIGDDVPLEYVINEGLRVLMRGDTECMRVSPPARSEKLRHIELSGDVAARLDVYQAKLGGKDRISRDFIIEELLRQLMARDSIFKRDL